MAAAASTLHNPINNILSLKLPEKMYHYMYAPYFQAIPAPQQASLPIYPRTIQALREMPSTNVLHTIKTQIMVTVRRSLNPKILAMALPTQHHTPHTTMGAVRRLRPSRHIESES